MKQSLLASILLAAACFSMAAPAAVLASDLPPSWASGLSDMIRTPRITVDGDWMLPPVITLGSDSSIEFSFDEMSHDFHQYCYHIDHCDADWNKSGLLYSEYMDGFDGENIYDSGISQNTCFEYTHYSLVFPNPMNSPKLSGNYVLTVLEDDRAVAVFRFCIAEPAIKLEFTAQSTTDIDTRESHQQIRASADTEGLASHNPRDEFMLTVMQNLRFDNAATVQKADFINGSRLSWEHCAPLVFNAGNGFRRFEITDVYANMFNVDRISYHEPYYHAVLNKDAIRRQFMYNGDHNGRVMVRSTATGVSNADTGSDYIMVHFTLDSPRMAAGAPYLFFLFDAGGPDKRYRMEYNSADHAYELAVPLKMGSYDYMYLWVADGSKAAATDRIEGDFHETENEYLLLLYQRRPGERYDRLVATARSAR